MDIMTNKERIKKAFSNTGEPDRVPFEPGLDFDTLTDLSGLDYWEYKDSGHKELSELISWCDKLGFGLYYFAAGIPEPSPAENIEININRSQQDDVRIVETNISTAHGNIQQRLRCPRFAPEYAHEKFIKDLHKDWPAFREYFGENWQVAPRYFDEYKLAGDRGVVGVVVHTPIDFWQEYRHGGAEQMIYDCFDEKKIMEELCQWYRANSLAYLEAVSKLDPKPDFVMIHGSNCSASLISPNILKTYALPYIQEASRFLKNADILSLFHVCGRCSEWLSMIGKDFE